MLTLIAELILAPAGTMVGLFLDEEHAAFPVYQLLVTFVVMVTVALAFTEGYRAWHYPER